jgi:hypothetical protein
MTAFRGKSLIGISKDIAEGYVTVNPIFLKPLNVEDLEALYKQIVKLQVAVRGEKFPHGNVRGIRERNIRLQRLHSSLIIIRAYAKDRGLKHLI